MANCAVINCSSSYYQYQRWLKNHQCPHYQNVDLCQCERPFTLRSFPPQGSQEYHKWCVLLNRKDVKGRLWLPKKYSRICSLHFQDRNSTEPTLNMGYDLKSARPRPLNKLARAEIEDCNSNNNNNDADYHDDESEWQDVEVQENVGDIEVLKDHTYSFVCNCGCDECSGCNAYNKENLKLKERIDNENYSNHVHSHNAGSSVQSFFAKKILKSDKLVKRYTGLSNKLVFHKLFNCLRTKASKLVYWKGIKNLIVSSKRNVAKRNHTASKPGRKRQLSCIEEFILVLVKLRMNLTFHMLSDLFNVATSVCSSIFNTWIKFLSQELKNLIYWPSKVAVLDLLPNCYRSLTPKLRCIIDCTEVFIERPRMLNLQCLTWSDYKKHNTAKFLIAIAPNGAIVFLSSAWGGRTSDRHILRESGFLNLIDYGDQILADRGFSIEEELLLKNAKLFIPPPSKGQEQMTTNEVVKTKRVANTRIHVERAIGRIKEFEILNSTIPINLVPLIDNIAIVCAALCNLLPPLVK